MERGPNSVMPGFMPGIHVLRIRLKEDVDGRDKPGHDDCERQWVPKRDRRDKPGDDDCARQCILLVMAGLVPGIPLSEALPFVRSWGQVGDEEVTAARASAAGHP